MAIILSLLSIVTVICVYINYTTTINYGSGQMQRNAANYEYQLSEWINTQNIVSLPYNSVEVNGESIRIIKDYDDRYKVIISTRNEMSGFSIYVVTDLFYVYGSALISGTICLVALITCVILVYILMTNLTKLQNKTNRKLKESADAAIEADKAKSDFLAQMSHEIRTPINTVLGMNEMIMHETSDPRIKDYSSNIQNAGKTLLSLINSILDFSKIEDNKMEIIPVEYSTAALISDLAASAAQRAKNKGLELVVDADETLPSILRGDDVRIKQIILNLLTNAVKYTEKGSVTLTVKEEKRNGNKCSRGRGNGFCQKAVQPVCSSDEGPQYDKAYKTTERSAKRSPPYDKGNNTGA